MRIGNFFYRQSLLKSHGNIRLPARLLKQNLENCAKKAKNNQIRIVKISFLFPIKNE